MEEWGEDYIYSCPWARFYNNTNEAEFQNKVIDKDYDNPVEWLKESWMGKGKAQTSVWLTPKKLLDKVGKWDEKILLNQDGEYFTRVLLQAKGIKFSPDSKVYYRSGIENSVSSSKKTEQKLQSLLYTYESYAKNTLKKDQSEDIKKALANNFMQFIYEHYANKELRIKAETSFRELGFNNFWPVGGKRFRQLSAIIGVKNALRIRELLS